MDDIVRQAMAKWPHVPHCYGWLGLDARGHWYMRDDRTQAAGPFAGGNPHSKGSLLRHDKLVEFIGRNYLADAQGCWYFQNGPQRVFVELESAPWVWRLGADHTITAHTGQSAVYRHCLVDETGHVYLDTTLGLGLVHTLDVAVAADALDSGAWALEEVLSGELPQRFGFIKSPAAAQNATKKEA